MNLNTEMKVVLFCLLFQQRDYLKRLEIFFYIIIQTKTYCKRINCHDNAIIMVDKSNSVRVPILWTSLKTVREVNAAVIGKDATIHDVDVFKIFKKKQKLQNKKFKFFHKKITLSITICLKS